MGTVYFNKQRRKYGIDYIASDGRRIRKLIGSGDEGKRNARLLLEKCEAEVVLQLHGVIEPEVRFQGVRFRDFAAEWYERAEARRLAPKTLESYDDTLEHPRLYPSRRFSSDLFGRRFPASLRLARHAPDLVRERGSRLT